MPIQRLSNAGQSGYRYKSLIAGITPVASVPTIGTATALTYSTASVTFTAPGAYGATTFTATSSPGGLTGTSATSPITVSGLSEQTAYTFTVTATNATGTSRPSAASSSITTPVAWFPDSGYDSLATVTLSTSATSITFAGIPVGYSHLQIRGTYTGTDVPIPRFNGDSGSNYSFHGLRGNGSAASAYAVTNNNNLQLGTVVSPTSTYPLSFIFDIFDYANVNKYKTTRSLGGSDQNGSGGPDFSSGVWMNTSAITSITIPIGGSGTAYQYSTFALYGIK